MTTKLLIDRELRSVLGMILNALDRDTAEGKTSRGEMAAELRAALAAPVQGEADYDAELHASWLSRMTEICKEYRTAEDGADVRDVWKSLMAHLDCQPASMTALTDGELRAGIAIQRSEIDRLRQQLRDEGDRIAHLRTAMETILPYVKDKRVTGRKPLKDGVYTMHIGQIIRDALDAVQPPASAAPRQPEAVADEREAFEEWLGITPCGAAHDLAVKAFQAGAAYQRQSVVMPNRMTDGAADYAYARYSAGWNACLDEFARLNGAGSHE